MARKNRVIEKSVAWIRKDAGNQKKFSLLIKRRLNNEEIKILFIEYETRFCYL